MNFEASDFKSLQYNVFELQDSEKVLEKWTELARYPEFTTALLRGISRDKVIRYVILCYDKKTPLLSEKNLMRRKKLAASFAGFEKNKSDVFEDSVMDMINNENKAIVRMIIRYVRIQSDMRFTLLVSGMETYYENIIRITNSGKDDGDVLDSTEKSKLFNESKKMSDDLEKLADEIFNNDTEILGEADEVNEEESDRITSWPEYWAKKKKEKVELKE